MIIPSANVSNFDFKAVIDISVPSPTLAVTDISTYIGSGATNIIGIDFTFVDPSNISFHASVYPPDIDIYPGLGSYSRVLPIFAGQPKWGKYRVYATLIDQDGTQYVWSDASGVTYKEINLCRPNTLQNASGALGGLLLNADFDCDSGTLLVQDGGTGFSYLGISPSATTTNIVVTYPADPTGFVLTQVATFIPFTLPITLNGTYSVSGQVTETYNLTDTTTIIAGYTYSNSFDVQCGFTLCKALCEYESLWEEVKNCDFRTTADTNLKTRQFLLITGLLTKIQAFKNCGKKFGDILAQIQQIGNFDCNCDCSPQGIAPSPVFFGGTLVKGNMCGDINLVLTQIGSNVKIDASDLSYFVTESTASSSFLSVNVTSGVCSKTFTIDLNVCNALKTASISCLADVSTTPPTNGQILVWDSGSGKYIPTSLTQNGGLLYENLVLATIPNNNTENTIYTYSLAAATGTNVPYNTLSKDGDMVRGLVAFQNQLASNANDRTIKFKFAGVTILSFVFSTTVTEFISLRFEIIRVNANNQIVNLYWDRGNLLSAMASYWFVSTGVADLTAINAIAVTGQNTNAVASSVNFVEFYVELVKKL